MSAIEFQDPAGDVRKRQLDALAGVIQLEKRARAAKTAEEFGFIAVNDTHAVISYRQAVLWRTDGHHLQALSGLASPDRNAPFCVWLSGFFRTRLALEDAAKPRTIGAADLPDADRENWAEYLPQCGAWLPLLRTDGSIEAVLLLARDEPWQDAEFGLLDYVVDAYAHAWSALVKAAPKRHDNGERKRASIVLGLTAVLVLLAPVRQSVLAPAEIVPLNPVVLRSPVDGVIANVDVQPNQSVRTGQLLASLDPREVRSKLDVAQQALAVADAELRQAQELAVFDDKGKANLAVLQGRRAGQAAEVTYLQGVLARLELRAPRPGVAIFDDASELVGKPVSIGERIMTVADPVDAELEVYLAVGDAVALPPAPRSSFI